MDGKHNFNEMTTCDPCALKRTNPLYSGAHIHDATFLFLKRAEHDFHE